jgi:hypothetical protein
MDVVCSWTRELGLLCVSKLVVLAIALGAQNTLGALCSKDSGTGVHVDSECLVLGARNAL